ncbi:rCG46350 [Rattus norvegicus]|uniref:RCG46350 n=1 Tax=Rattus norvegicus TaxID=10116 RepID=A6ICQ5_RAT|nr:rCG46350 [Rattus norvegicus]
MKSQCIKGTSANQQVLQKERLVYSGTSKTEPIPISL